MTDANTPDRYDEAAPEWMLTAAREYLATAPWKTSKNGSHSYMMTPRAHALGIGRAHALTLVLICDHGIDRTWYGHGPYRGIDLDGWSLWKMGDMMIINRKPDRIGWLGR
ncbi:MAG TPA: hypothetical protein VGM70_11950 [Pseudolysinimonas sp.]